MTLNPLADLTNEESSQRFIPGPYYRSLNTIIPKGVQNSKYWYRPENIDWRDEVGIPTTWKIYLDYNLDVLVRYRHLISVRIPITSIS